MKRLTLLLYPLAGVALAFVVAAAAAACRNDVGGISGCPSAEVAGPPVDTQLMAFLSAARALHHEADIKEQSGDDDGAVAALERLARMPAPQAIEVDEVLADAHARLAELRLRRADLDGADRDVRLGLDRAKSPTYFRGHLLEVEGLVEEARASTLSDAGRTDEAARAKAQAISLLEEAVHVQELVIQHALGDKDGGAGE
jgi:tetratricopeptide (TPR) repeat protein